MALNGLQTNAAVLEHVRKARREAKAAGTYERSNEISKMYQYLQRTGLKVRHTLTYEHTSLHMLLHTG